MICRFSLCVYLTLSRSPPTLSLSLFARARQCVAICKFLVQMFCFVAVVLNKRPQPPPIIPPDIFLIKREIRCKNGVARACALYILKIIFLYLVSTLTNNRYYVWTFLGARFARYCSHMEWCGFFGLCWIVTALDLDGVHNEEERGRSGASNQEQMDRSNSHRLYRVIVHSSVRSDRSRWYQVCPARSGQFSQVRSVQPSQISPTKLDQQSQVRSAQPG